MMSRSSAKTQPVRSRLVSPLLSLLLVFACINTTLVDRALAQNTTTKIAYIGDMGVRSSVVDVLDLINRDEADLVVVLGDLSYQQGTPQEWLTQFDESLGADFPILGLVGNHEEDEWWTFQSLLTNRLARTPQLDCSGEYGVKGVCRMGAVTIVAVAPGISEVPGVNGGDDYETYITNTLQADEAPFRVCAWHKNQREMQIGQKGNETGWGVFRACRLNSAMVANGHSHTYSRSHLMSSFEQQTIASTSNTLAISAGKSVVTVSGLGGATPRVQRRDGPWWAAKYSATQNAKHGALFCEYSNGERPLLAECYFKNVDDEVIDSFTVLSHQYTDTQLSVSDLTVNENIGTASVTTRLTNVAPDPVSFTLKSDSDGTAQPGSDYFAVDQRVTIPVGVTSTTTNVSIIDDNVVERTESFKVRLSNPSGATLADDTATVTINDDDVISTPATLTIKDTSVSEGAGTASATIALSRPLTNAVRVRVFNRSTDSASAPQDYYGFSRTVTLPAGTTQATTPIVIVDDYLPESAETFSVRLLNAEGAVIEDGVGIVTITDDDDSSLPTFSVSSTTHSEGSSTATATVTLSQPVDASVRIHTRDVSATRGTDYYGFTRTLNFSGGTTELNVPITVLDDSTSESTERFILRLFDPQGARIGVEIGTVTITDDD